MFETHGHWCGARTYPTRCRYCGSGVFYFSCNCGSKVFFDELGGQWQEHRCVQYLVVQYGKEFVGRGLAQQMMRPGIARKYRFDDEYERKMQGAAARPPQHRIIRRDAPRDAEVATVGVVREFIAKPDIFKRTGLADSVIGRALLGPLGREAHCQITVHVGSLAEENVDSFTFYAPERLVTPLGPSVGSLISFTIQSHVIPGHPVWIASKLALPI